MIRSYINIPRFDDGWNFDYNQAFQYPTQEPPVEYRVTPETPDINGSYNSVFLNPDGSYSQPTLRRSEELQPNRILEQNIRDFQNDLNRRSAPKRITTAAQDYKSAESRYRKSIDKADIKAKEEARKAEQEQKRLAAEVERKRKLSEQRKAELDRLRARSAYWKSKQSAQRAKLTKETGKYGDVYSAYAGMQAGAVGRNKTKSKIDTRGGYASIGGAAWRPGKQASSSNRGHELIRALASFFTSTPNGKTYRKPTNSINGINYGRPLLK